MQSKNRITFRIVGLCMAAVIGTFIWQLSSFSAATTVENKTVPQKIESLSKAAAAATIAIQIDPAVKNKGIDLSSLDNIEVAVLGNANFDAKAIDPATLNFAGASILKRDAGNRAGEQHDLNAALAAATSTFDITFKDVNGDGRGDLVAHFSIPYLSQLSEGFHEAILTASTFDGLAVRGSDYVTAYGKSVLESANRAAPAVLLCNNTTITIPSSGAATPYPSNIPVAGLTGVVSNVTVTLNGFSHTFPSDIAVMMVGPTGQKVILMGRSGSGTDAVNANLTFDDAATSYLPSAIVTGTFKPTNLSGGGFVFSAPAPAVTPASPAAATLSAFNNTDPNGTWSLYVFDFATGDTGQFSGGWCLNITTAASVNACPLTLIQSTITGSDTTQTSRLFRDGVPSVCTGVPKTCPGPSGTATLHFKTFSVTNNNTSTQCVTVTTTSACGVNVFVSAYLTSFNPASLCTNYLADSGVSPSGTGTAVGTSFSFSVPAGATFILHAVEISANIGCTGFSLLVEGNLCAPVGGCTITCPANLTVGNDPNQCGAVVNYPPPTSTGTCGTIACFPPSGSFFPVGTTTVTCTSASPTGPTNAPTGVCTTITHSSSQTISPLTSVSCNDGSGHTDNSYYRAFSLPSFGILGDFGVTSVDVGIESATSGAAMSASVPHISPKGSKADSNAAISGPAGGGPGQSVTVNLYTSSSPFPTGFPGSLTLIGTSTTTVADQSLTILNIPVTGNAPAGSELVVEIFTPNGQAAGNLFFIGSNSAPETGPSYLRAPDCGVNNPTPTAGIGFPNMHIVLNVNGCPSGPTCQFTVTVNDTQPPVITCPANITAVTDQTVCPPEGTTPCVVVNFTATASDNCPGVTVVCVPPSGTCIPIGVTTVTCTATDASGNTATCSFAITTFDVLLQDDTDPTIVLLWNSQTGQYRFCCGGTIFTGVGKATRRGCQFTLVHEPLDRRVDGQVEKTQFRGNARLQAPDGTLRCTITDRDIRNDTNLCGGVVQTSPTK